MVFPFDKNVRGFSLAICFDIVEFLAVFLLAVEAIKLENLRVVVHEFLKPLIARLNPKIEFVDDTSHLGFFERHTLTFVLLAFYLAGLTLVAAIFHILQASYVNFLSDTQPFEWILFVIGLLLVPIVAGLLAYQCVVWFLELSVKALTWVQLKTHTGAVGILGFLLFAFQFWGRRVLLS